MPPEVSRISQETLDAPVAGSGLHAGGDGRATLRAQLDPARPTLLLFLRHLGCIFCREMVKDARIAADRADAGQPEKRYPRVVFVHTATPEQGGRFFGRYWPGATAISDPEERLYGALGLRRGGVGQLFGMRVWACAARAAMKGHGIGKPAGDPWMMPGAFLVSPEGRILHDHRSAHIGDHPSFQRYADIDASLAETPGNDAAAGALAQPA